MVVEQLCVEGYHADVAETASEACGLYSQTGYDLVLCDLWLPGENGMSVLGHLKDLDEDAAVIMVTGANDVKTATECLREGAQDYITKPFEWKDLFVAVERALEARSAAIEARRYGEVLEQSIRRHSERLALKDREMSTLMINTIQSLVSTLEAKDTYTEDHSWKVALLGSYLARELDLDSDIVDNISLAGLLHDIGKIGVRDAILNKPGSLTDDEFAHIQQHPVISEKILAPLDALRKLLPAIRHHHERFDGRGYPDGFAGEKIPLEARILALADSFDAITSQRAYRPARSLEVALLVIEDAAGTQFDPQLTEAFVTMQRASIEGDAEG